MTDDKTTGGILFTDLEEEMKDSYITYAMSVIVGRALPDVRDGLKPVHRRILYAMHESGMVYNKPYKKSARVVGNVLGKYHPHGDSAVYDAMTRMVQDFSLRYPLIDGQGNFGSLDGDPAAAMRYTECRMGRIASEIIRGIEKETVPFMPNYDESESEPMVLPSPLPNLLINGSTGIAVGMATNIPPHNLGEIIAAFNALIDNPELTPTDMLRYIKGPDFPTGGIIYGREGIRDYFKTGRGRVVIRARTRIEPGKNDRERIIITDVPYQVNKAHLIEAIAALVKAKKVEGISDIRDESDKDGIRVVIELKRGAMSQIILNQLYKHTQLQVSFGVIMLALMDNKPRVMNIVEVMKAYLGHRELMTVRALTYDLKIAERRAHILEGLKIALDNLDAVIKTIRSSPDTETARAALIKKFTLSRIQAQAILDMRLQRLTGLERTKIDTEYLELIKTIEEVKSILASRTKILDVVRKELEELKKQYADPRRTAITDNEGDFSIEDLIAEEEMVITITHGGYIKRQALSVYRKQGRGGKGITGMGTKEADFITSSFIAGSHDYILFFTDKGKVYWLKVYVIPEASRLAKGRPMINLLQVESGESITAHVPIKEFSPDRFLFMVTKNGIIKKTNLEAYSRPRAGGINGIVLDKEDRLIRAMLTDGKMDILLATMNGQALRFGEEQCRSMGRVSRGVKGITLSEGDAVVGAAVVAPEATLLAIKSDGLGKRTKFDAYRRQRRGGKGIINIKLGDQVRVVGVMSVRDDDEVMCTTQKGIMIRTAVQGISVVGRSTKGVRIIRLNKNDVVGAITRVDMLDKKEENGQEEGK